MDLLPRLVCIIMVFAFSIVENEGAAYGGDCSGTGTPCADANNVCDTGTELCICATNFYRKANAAECAAQVAALDDTCDATDSASDQCAVTDSECRIDGTAKCLCKATHFVDGGVCTLRVGFELECDAAQIATDQCSVAETECKDDAGTDKCLCKAVYYSDGSACQTRKYPDADCAVDECVINASCVETKCACDAGYTPSPTVSPTMCNGVVKITAHTLMYVTPFLVSLMFLLP